MKDSNNPLNKFRFPMAEKIDLNRIETDADAGFASDEDAQQSLQQSAFELVEHQDMLMAHSTYGLLVLFQGMDASGKDEAITHVFASVDPRGSEFKQFQTLTEKEEKHDYLWRVTAALPARGQIGIFARSYYEHVVTDRIHPEKLEQQRLPTEAKKNIWPKRYQHINNFENYLVDNGIHVLKFFLHVSKEEQRKRLLERIDRADQRWQFSSSDVEDRAFWKQYMKFYGEALTETNTEHAPWYVIPADKNWQARAAIASVTLAKLQSLHNSYPKPSEDEQRVLSEARKKLEKDE